MATYCCVPGCERVHNAFGYCKPHRRRIRLYGSPTGGPRSDTQALNQFIALAVQYQGDECLLWPYGVSQGYGQIGGHKSTQAHAIVCELAHGPKPPDKCDAAHSCGTRACVNPRHLRWATRKENHADMIRHGRSTRGTKQWNAKLTEQQVQEIRAAGSKNQKATAKRYGITFQSVSDIQLGRTWAWLQSDGE